MNFDVFAPDPSPPTGADRLARIESEGRRRLTRRRGALGAFVAVTLVIAAVPLVSIVTSKAPNVTSKAPNVVAGVNANEQGTVEALAHDAWSRIAPAPIPDRLHAAYAWTGTEMLVWGGDPQPPSAGGPLRADGAAYDPRTDSWRALSPSPLSGRTATANVWTGSEWFVWGGYDSVSGGLHVADDGAIYDPVTDRWTAVPAAPIAARGDATAAWTGDEVVVFGGHPAVVSTTRAFTDAAAYNPSTNRWRMLPALPAVAGHTYEFPDGVWTDSKLLVWWAWQHTEQHGNEVTGRSGYDLFAFDPRSDAWQLVEDRRPAGTGVSSPFWTGRDVLIPATEEFRGYASGPPQMGLRGSRYDPSTNEWRQIAAGFQFGHGIVAWTGSALVELSTSIVRAWDPAQDAWRDLPTAPLYAQAAAPLVWTGTELLVWGGMHNPSSRGAELGAGMRFGPT